MKYSHGSYFRLKLSITVFILLVSTISVCAQEKDEYEGYIKPPKTIIHCGIEYPFITKIMNKNNQTITVDQGMNFGVGAEFKISKLQYLNCTFSYHSDEFVVGENYENEVLTKWQSLIIGIDLKKLFKKPSHIIAPYAFAGTGIDINTRKYLNKNEIPSKKEITNEANGIILRGGGGLQYSNNYISVATDIRVHFTFLGLSQRNNDYFSVVYSFRVGYNL